MNKTNSKNDIEENRISIKRIACCGPGRRRHLLPILCTFALTVVIGMRAEMLSIIHYIDNPDIDNNNNNNNDNNDNDDSMVFRRQTHRKLPWTPATLEDYIENAFFIANVLSSPIGGYLTVNHDPSLLLGSSVAMTCGLNLFLPLAATIGGESSIKITMVIVLRVLQGFAEGCLIPAMFGVLRYWAPISELSSIVCFSVIGVSLGPLIGLPICVAIEVKWGWGVVFYIYANLGLIWCIFWWRLVDDKPQRSKFISRQELEYILQGVQPSNKVLNGQNKRIPWKQMLTSKAVFAIFVTYAADDWTFQITSVCMQSYYNTKFKTDISRTINLLVYPFLARSLLVPIGGVVADLLGYFSNLKWLTIRKILTALGFGLKAVFFVSMAFVSDELTATIMLSLCLGFSGLAVAGYAVNVLEIAPDYSGLIMGIASSISTFSAILSVAIASFMVSYISKPNGWIIALSSAAAIQLFSMIMYLIMAQCDLQSWATFPDQPSDTGEKVPNTTEMPISIIPSTSESLQPVDSIRAYNDPHSVIIK